MDSRLQKLCLSVARILGAQCNDLHAGHQPDQFAGAMGASAVRQVDVEQHDWARIARKQQPQPLIERTGGEKAAAGKSIAEQRDQRLAENRMIINDQKIVRAHIKNPTQASRTMAGCYGFGPKQAIMTIRVTRLPSRGAGRSRAANLHWRRNCGMRRLKISPRRESEARSGIRATAGTGWC